MFHACSGIFTTLELSNILCKTKIFQAWNKICFICVILGFNFEKLLPYLKSAPLKISENAKFRAKIKIFKFATKNALFSIFFRLKSLNKSYNWNQYSQTCEKASRATQKVSILELRMPYLYYFGLKVYKSFEQKKNP